MKFWLATGVWFAVGLYFRIVIGRIIRYGDEAQSDQDQTSEPWEAPPTAWGASRSEDSRREARRGSPFDV
jgi:hypothetical protein